MREKTGPTVADHPRLTIERHDAIRAPVPSHFHVRGDGDRLAPGVWVGGGSVCKRDGKPDAIEAVLHSIKVERPDLRLDGYGLTLTALGNASARENLESSDSMAWSFGAWKAGRDQNSWEDAADSGERVGRRLAA